MSFLHDSEPKLIYFFNSIEEYVSQRKYIERIPDIISQGLNVFLKYPNAKSVSLFMLKENTLEFELRSTLPSSSKDCHKEKFTMLIEEGYIGKVLELGEVQAIDGLNDAECRCVLIPLAVSWGIIGIVQLEIEEGYDYSEPLLNRLTGLLAGLFASALENSMLFKNLGTAKAVLEQKVTARTMDLAQSQREMKAILDSVHTGIIVYEVATKNIVRINPVAIALIGDRQENLLGNRVTNFLEEAEYNSDSINYDITKNYESVLTNARSEKIPIIRTSSYVNLGTEKYRIECFLDITEQKNIEEELKKVNEYLEMKVEERTLDLQLLIKKLKDEIEEHSKAQIELKRMLDKEKELNEMKTRFVSMVSHEFRTPLTVIRSAAQMMNKFRATLSEEENIEYINRIVKTVDTLTDLIENVLFIGKQSVSDSSLESPNDINLIDFTENLINEFKLTLLKPREIIFTTIGFSNQITTSDKLLRLILVNLISNAAKYSSPETVIEVKLYLNESSFTYMVRDYGIGIPEEEQQEIFSLFYRANNVGKVFGTGIGLPVVMNSIQMLNGTINLESKINHGTSITVTIPHLKNKGN